MNKLTLEKTKLITAMVIFGTIGLFVRNIPLPSSIIALSRGLIGVLFLLLITALKRTGISKKAIKTNLGWLVLSGAFLGMNWILLFESYRYTTVATATLCYYLAPTMVILAAPFVLKEKLTLRKLLCAVVALCGMVCVSGVLDSGILAGVSDGSAAGFLEGGIASSGELTGIFYGLGAAVLYACIMLINKKIHDISAYDKTIMQLGISAIVLLPYCLVTVEPEALQFSPYIIFMLLLVGILHTGITYYLYFGSMGHLKAQTVAIISYLDPVVAILLSIFVLGEGMNVIGIIGAVLILGSALFSELEK